jgi:hypothetical protein
MLNIKYKHVYLYSILLFFNDRLLRKQPWISISCSFRLYRSHKDRIFQSLAFHSLTSHSLTFHSLTFHSFTLDPPKSDWFISRYSNSKTTLDVNKEVHYLIVHISVYLYYSLMILGRFGVFMHRQVFYYPIRVRNIFLPFLFYNWPSLFIF